MLQSIYNIYRNLENNIIASFVSLLYNCFVVDEFKLCHIIVTYINVFYILFANI